MQPEEWGWCRCAGIPSGEVFCLHSKYIVYKSKPEDGAGVRGAPNTSRSQLTPNLVRSGILLIAGGSIWQICIFQPNMQAANWLPQFGQIWHLIGWGQFDSTNGNKIFSENGPNQQENWSGLFFLKCFLSDPGVPGVRSLGPDVTNRLNWCDSGWWRYQLNTKW